MPVSESEPKDFLEKLERKLADPHLLRVTVKADELRHLVQIARLAVDHYAWPAGTEMGIAIRNANLLREEDSV